MTKRRGVSLVEALVALFVAALGMTALLTLFPLGALQMGQALKDGRCAQSAQEADSLIRWYWEKYQPNSTANTELLASFSRGDYLPPPSPRTEWIPPTDAGPSFPIFIDPLGEASTWPSGPLQKNRVGNFEFFPRRVPKYLLPGATTEIRLLPTTAQIFRFCMLQDELNYSQAGTPQLNAADKIERGSTYTWAWLVQRPNNQRLGQINMSVVVFDNFRPAGYADLDTERTFPETAAQIVVTPGTTALTLPYDVTRPKPRLMRGRWLLDVTPVDPATSARLRHAIFYRVVSVNDEIPGQLNIEVETPFRRSDERPEPYNGTFIVMPGVVEVFERPPITIPGPVNN